MRTPFLTTIAFPGRRPRPCRGGILAVAFWIGCVTGGIVRAEGPVAIRVEQTDAGGASGRLLGLEGASLRIDAGGQERVIPIDTVRVVEREGAPSRAAGRVRVALVDGAWIEGDDLAWDGALVSLTRPDGRGEIPVGKVQSVAWRQADDGAQAPGAAWLSALPETIESDLLVVGSAAGHEFVECAIKSIGPDAITVVLDEETIPVKRSKVIGIHWLRADPAAGRNAAKPAAVAIDLVGGAMRAREVAWTPEKLLLDGDISLPGEAVVRLDWAAGRTVSLIGLAPERLEVEPWYGDLARVPGLASYFAPRSVAAGDGGARPGLVIRPRTRAVWRLPAEGRRFRASITPAGGGGAVGGSEVVVTVDDREVFRRRIEAGSPEPGTPDGIPIDVDVSGGRRLGVTVDFVSASDSGCPIRFTSPAVEQ